jgi:hypothetical protein
LVYYFLDELLGLVLLVEILWNHGIHELDAMTLLFRAAEMDFFLWEIGDALMNFHDLLVLYL